MTIVHCSLNKTYSELTENGSVSNEYGSETLDKSIGYLGSVRPEHDWVKWRRPPAPRTGERSWTPPARLRDPGRKCENIRGTSPRPSTNLILDKRKRYKSDSGHGKDILWGPADRNSTLVQKVKRFIREMTWLPIGMLPWQTARREFLWI